MSASRTAADGARSDGVGDRDRPGVARRGVLRAGLAAFGALAVTAAGRGARADSARPSQSGDVSSPRPVRPMWIGHL